MTTDTIAQQMVADINACRHFGLAAHERVRRDTTLAWLRDQRKDMDVSSMSGLFAHWSKPEAHRQQRIICLIAAREQQLRQFPASFHSWMIRARDCRRQEMKLREQLAPKPVSVFDVADIVSTSILSRSMRVA